MQWNWVDVVVILAIIASTVHGWRMGGIYLGGTLLSFLVAFWCATRISPYIGIFLNEKFGIPRLWGDIAGYVIVAILAQMIASAIFNHYISKLPKKVIASKASLFLGLFIGLLNGILILAVFFIIFLILPLRGTVRNDITNSQLGSRVVDFTKRYGGELTTSLDKITRSTVRFLTVTPGSRDRANLPFVPAQPELAVDQSGEDTLLRLINAERMKANVPTLTLNTKVRDVARSHSREMFQKQYFSHIDMEGKDGEARLKKAGIAFTFAGENLAYSSDVATAHTELMDSQNHRRNLLDPEYKYIGIGIIDAGMYGKMITQDFTN